MLTRLKKWLLGSVLINLLLALPFAALPDPKAYVNFSFDQVDIRTFVKLVGDITGQTFVIDPGVEGRITVVTLPIPASQVYPLFVAVLESAGCSVMKDGVTTRISQIPARIVPAAPVIGAAEPMPEAGMVTKVLHLQYVSAVDVRKAIESKVAGGKAGAIAALELTNHLILTDTVDGIRKIEKIVAEIDKPGLARTAEVIALEYANAEEVAQQLMIALAGAERPGEQLARRLPKITEGGDDRAKNVVIVAAPHSNSLIAVGTPADVTKVRDLVKLVDVDSPSGRGRLHSIALKYISAEDAAKSLNALFDKTVDKKPEQTVARKVAIEASAGNNALLIEASPRDFEVVRELVDQLDQVPEQVLINVTIAEVSLSDELDVGVELAALDAPAQVGDTVIQGSSKVEDSSALMNAVQNGIFPRGITVGLAHGTSVDSDGKVVASLPALISLNAVKKNASFKILSDIPLLAQNNKEASASVVNNIPILKSTIQGGSGTSRDVIQNIDRVDVGIKLKLTPHINPDSSVRMVLNPSIEAVIDPGAASLQFTPTIAKREVSTTVTVPDGQTIVISGLIREDQTKVVRKIPLLGSIPLIGWLFRHTVDGRERTNLLIFVTPHIVTQPGQVQAMSRKWEQMTGLSATNAAPPPPAE